MKRNLVFFGLLLSLIGLTSSVYAAPQIVAADVAIDADGIADGVSFTANKTLTVPDGTAVNTNNNVDGILNNVLDKGKQKDKQGTVTFLGASVTQGNIGADGAALKQINISGGAVSTTGNIFSDKTVFTGDGSLSLADTKNLTSNITTNTDNTGTLILNGAHTITGDIGKTDKKGNTLLKQISVNGTVGQIATFDGKVNTTILNFGSGGTAAFTDKSNLEAAVTTSTDNTGVLTFNGKSEVNKDTGFSIGTLANKIAQINVDGAGKEVKFGGNIFATTLNISADGKATINDGFDVTSAITTSTDDTGTLKSEGTNTFTGQVGQAGMALNLVEAGQKSGKLTTFQNDIFATTLDVGQGSVQLNGDLTGTLSFNDKKSAGVVNVADGKTVDVVTTTTDGQGTLTFDGATTTGGTIGTAAMKLFAVNFNGATSLGHDIGALTTTVKTGSTVTLANNVGVNGDVTLENATTSILDLGTNTLTLSGTGIFTSGAMSVLRSTLTNTTYGNIVASGDAAFDGSTLDLVIGSFIPNGTVFTILDGGATGVVTVPGTITDNSAVLSFEATSVAGDLILTAMRSSPYNIFGSNSNAQAVGEALERLGAEGGSGLDEFLALLDTLSPSEIADILDRLSPTADGAVVNTSFSMLDGLINLVRHRLESFTSASSGETGMSSGGDMRDQNLWVQGFGAYAHQGSRGLSRGYNSTLYGTAIGWDRPLRDDSFRAGVSAGYSAADIDSKDFNAQTDVDSYQIGIYGGYQNPNHPYYIDLSVTTSFNHYDSVRDSFNTSANSDYRGQQSAVTVGGGYIFKNGSVNITPDASLKYAHLNLDAYDETGAGPFNLSVGEQSYDLLQMGLGAKVSRTYEWKSGLFTPEFHAKFFYDFLGERQETVSSFVGAGGVSFVTQGYKPAQDSYNAGVKLALLTARDITFSVNYDFDVKQDFYSHTGLLQVDYSF